jgi:FKBP-type peptidyl-prolyl cis-trans isomerase 2
MFTRTPQITIKAEDAFGKRDETLVRKYLLASLPAGFKPEKGMKITMESKTGKTIPAIIKETTENNITIDINHPFTGKDLIFEIKIVGIE